MSYTGRLLEAHVQTLRSQIEDVQLCRVAHRPHSSDDKGWVTHRVVAALRSRELGHITLSHIPQDVYDETLADPAKFWRVIKGFRDSKVTAPSPEQSAFEKFHVGSVHVAYVSVLEMYRRHGIARRLYLEAARWMGEEGLLLAAGSPQMPEVRALWLSFLQDENIPIARTKDGRLALDYRKRKND